MASDYTDIASLLPSAYSALHQRWSIWPCISSLTFSSPSPLLTSHGGWRRDSLHWIKGHVLGLRDRCLPSDTGLPQALRSAAVAPTGTWTVDLMGDVEGAHFHPWEGNISAASQPVPTNGTLAILKELCERKFYLHLQLYKLLIANVSIIFL